MGKLKAFYIELENPQGVFVAGQDINGRLVVELDAEMKMREVRLTFKGLANVYWNVPRTYWIGPYKYTRVEHYHDFEDYFNKTIPVFGRGMGMGDDNRLPPGQHVYPFSFQLPPNLPSSFEDDHGYIRYTIKGTIDKPWKFDHTTKRPFTVIGILDLNTQPNAAHGNENQKIKYLCCLCCKSGPITATLKLDRVGYVPGEAITFNAEIQNMTSRVCKVDVRLIMTPVFHTATESTHSIREVARVVHQDVQPGETEIWSGDRLVIPPIPPSFLNGCRIIDLNYSLQLCVIPSGPTCGFLVPLLIIIGTIPLHTVVQQYQIQHGTATAEQPALPQPELASSPTEAASPTTNLPSSSYGEYVFGKTNIREKDDSKHTMGEMDFAPLYTYYDMSKQ